MLIRLLRQETEQIRKEKWELPRFWLEQEEVKTLLKQKQEEQEKEIVTLLMQKENEPSISSGILMEWELGRGEIRETKKYIISSLYALVNLLDCNTLHCQTENCEHYLLCLNQHQHCIHY